MTARPRDRRGARSLGTLLAGLAAAALLAAPARAQGVLLEIRPRLGDTLRMRLDQTSEMSGTTRVGAADSTMTVTTEMHVRTHSVVQRSDASGTTVVATTDSVALSVAGSRSATPAAAAAAARRLQGRQAVLRLAPDGAAEVMGGDGDMPPALGALLAAMPASLPRTPVSVGASWVREMAIPGANGEEKGGTLRATSHLDSLSRGADVAYVSVRGAIDREGRAAELPHGVTLVMHGTVQGAMQVDRRRGWVTQSNTAFVINSVLSPPPGSADAPMRVRMRLTQLLRCDDAPVALAAPRLR